MTTQEQVKDIITHVLEDKKDCGGITDVVWIGAGGSNGGNYPAQYFMEHEARRIASHMVTSNELVFATPAYVGPTTLAVAVSMRGTPETIEAARVASAAPPKPSRPRALPKSVVPQPSPCTLTSRA